MICLNLKENSKFKNPKKIVNQKNKNYCLLIILKLYKNKIK